MSKVSTISRNDGTLPKRGDLAIHVQTVREHYIGQETQERTVVRIGRVTSVSRTGEVLGVVWPFSALDGSDKLPTPTKNLFGGAIHTVPAGKVDVDAALAEYATHTWPGHDTQIMPYEDAADARALVLRHKNGGTR